jgi:hypothetical protein
MTTDELLAKLDAEFNAISGELPAIYEKYGRVKYSYPDDKSFPMWEIRNRRDRQEEILEFKARLTQEVEKASK